MNVNISRACTKGILALVGLAFMVGCSHEDVDHPVAIEEGAKTAASKPQIVVYTARKEHLIKPLFDLYTSKTGVEIVYQTGKAGPLLERLKAEGQHTPADLLITVDAGNLWAAAEQGVLSKVNSKILQQNIPEYLRDPEGYWFGLSKRARTIVYSTERVKPEEMSTYEDLSSERWRGRLCLRTSKKVYNQSLVAGMIENLGEAAVENIVKGWVANLATDVMSNDTKVMEAIAEGQCDIGIVNTYYYGRLINKKPNLPLGLFWPNQQDRGVHINISGAGIVKHAKHYKQALALLEWLSAADAQGQFAELNQEYPVNEKIKASAEVQSWGDFKDDTMNVSAVGRLQKAAVMLMDRANYL